MCIEHVNSRDTSYKAIVSYVCDGRTGGKEYTQGRFQYRTRAEPKPGNENDRGISCTAELPCINHFVVQLSLAQFVTPFEGTTGFQ